MMTTTAIHERPMLMCGQMVRHTLADEKTQTRRVPSKSNSETASPWDRLVWDDSLVPDGAPKTFADDGYLHVATRPHPDDRQDDPGMWTLSRVYPRYAVGDKLWVRETWASEIPGCPRGITYRADHSDPRGDGAANPIKWRPSIFMPRWASRITLEITGVRVERLHDMSVACLEAEGFSIAEVNRAGKMWDVLNGQSLPQAAANFRELWDVLNGKTYPWASSPWVWVISFRRIMT
jgi:hypothetical protein